ncbi:kinase-like domain-containing protein [Halteromyces radiatus]|uniref:kinase-like domain-containing protein n=1 Tax=Halteromyces radiatus TaxID=101107 RepID=UPI00221F49DD|nr:kinase-like domain-containing protein [Halteromyces radiatus]KAI8089291.1 kinase-like domain-containing protein [Halteromyces radiatus]
MNHFIQKLKSQYLTDRSHTNSEPRLAKTWNINKTTSKRQENQDNEQNNTNNVKESISRFTLFDNGQHQHNIPALDLTSHSLSSSFYNLVHWRPHHHTTGKNHNNNNNDGSVRGEMKAQLQRVHSESCLGRKYGQPDCYIGKGAFGTVRLVKSDQQGTKQGFEHHNKQQQQQKLYAVKEFKRSSNESVKSYVERLTNEYLMTAILHHRNIVDTVDLVPLHDDAKTYCQVMEYCNAGDLFGLITQADGPLLPEEANCFFKQLIHGVHYLHANGIAHRDLKPENLLLTTTGCLKIADFGSAVYFTGDEEMIYCKGACGSLPYIAPEELEQDSYDARAVDVWSCGIVFNVMRKGGFGWKTAQKNSDKDYELYLLSRQLLEQQQEGWDKQQDRSPKTPQTEAHSVLARNPGFDIFTGYSTVEKQLLFDMLDPDPTTRLDINDLMDSIWFQQIVCCQE